MIRTTILAGAALALFSVPAFAGHSSRAEQEATRLLNIQAAQSGAANNPEPKVAVIDASKPGNVPPSAAPTSRIETSAITQASAAILPLSQVSNPSARIATANVLNADGKTIGAVQRVEIAPNGTPSKVDVALLGTQEKTVELDARNVLYDPAGNTITAKDIS
jgi:hypothetical protein